MHEAIRVRVYDARYQSAFTTRILAMLAQETRVIASASPLDVSAPGRKALIAFTAPADEDISRYDWIHVAGAGIDKIAKGLGGIAAPPVMTRTVGMMGHQIAEYCLSYVLADFQRHAVRQEAQVQRIWDQTREAGRYLFETEVVIIGTGAIGQAIARAFSPLARRVTGFSASGRPKPFFAEVHPLRDAAPLGSASVVILALPATREAVGAVDDRVLSQLDAALLLNIGRGEPLDEGALLRALGSGRVRHAVLDVFALEPLPAESWLWDDDRVTVTSHLSGITRPEDTVAAFLQHLEEAGDGLPQGTVDPTRGY